MRAVTSSRLSLVLPSLPDEPLEFLRHVQASAEHGGESFASLRRILSRADKSALPITDRQALIFFLLSGERQDSPPVAALRALADNVPADDTAYWLCADPVHLYPDLDHLLLFSGESYAPTPAQAAKLVAELNQLFHEDGFEFIVGTAGHWYLRCPQAPDVSFTALGKVTGKNVLHAMPVGTEQARWRRYLNEIQMQMTASEVNRQREESAMPTVNSVWCWGGGRLPECRPSIFSRVSSQQAFTRGLARHLQVDVVAVPDSATQCAWDVTEQLIEFDELPGPDDPQGFMQYLVRLQREYLSPLCTDIKQGRLDELVIYFSGQRFIINRKTLRRWWRRSRPLHDIVA